MNTLVTGVAGFIGMHAATRLLQLGDHVCGVDSLNSYYDRQLKLDRLKQLTPFANFHFHRLDLADKAHVARLFVEHPPDRVIHLAAQAGVRYSIDHPEDYISSNVIGFFNLLEECRGRQIQHLVYASSSSVYGDTHKLPFAVGDPVNRPISLYAATKTSNELMAHVYAHLFRLPCTGLRFFTVYGPWGRPDMAIFSFTKSILEGKPITLFNNGNMERDFTYVDDIANAVARVLALPPKATAVEPPYRLYNVGNQQPIKILKLIEVLERHLSKKATVLFEEIQAGDVHNTFADINDLIRDTGFVPLTSINAGLVNFVDWYRNYYKAPVVRLQDELPPAAGSTHWYCD
jgi:UDP-glucuronate 4-epimerase